MNKIKKVAPYVLEMNTKFFSFVTSVILAYSLTLSDFGEYSYVRSFVLVAGTLLLFGLQTSAFKFSNIRYALKNEFTKFVLLFVGIVGAIFWTSLYIFESQIFSKFQNDLGIYIRYLVVITMISLFFIVHCKAREKPLVGFSLAFFTVFSFFIFVVVDFYTPSIELNDVFAYLIWVNLAASTLALFLLFKSTKSPQGSDSKWVIRDWINVSSSLWLSGFLPMFLLQGLVIIFGIFFASDLLGYLGMAVLVVSNMAMFKEVSISLYLPKLINIYSKKSHIEIRILAKCITMGVLPIVLMLLGLLIVQGILIENFSPKISEEVVTLIYILGAAQIFMAIYQPIFRLLSAIGFHRLILNISLALLCLLIAMYVTFGILKLEFLMVASSAFVSLFAVLFSLIVLRKKWNKEND